MRISLGKRATAAIVVVVGLCCAGAALGYFTGAGSGTGTAKVGKAASVVSILGTTTGELYPGGPAATVKIKLDNTGAQSAYVNEVTLASIAADAAHSSCDTSLSGSPPPFQMSSVAVGKDLRPSEETEVTGALKMNDTGVSQDGCQGAELTLDFTSD